MACDTAALACQIAGRLLMAEYEEVDEDVLDAVAEVANMVVGNVKNALEDTLGSLALEHAFRHFRRIFRNTRRRRLRSRW